MPMPEDQIPKTDWKEIFWGFVRWAALAFIAVAAYGGLRDRYEQRLAAQLCEEVPGAYAVEGIPSGRVVCVGGVLMKGHD